MRDLLVVVHRLSSCGTQTPEQTTMGSGSFGVQAQLLHDMWELSSLTRDRTHDPCMEVHWTAREVPIVIYF